MRICALQIFASLVLAFLWLDRIAIVYSHRIYGEKVGDQMSMWLNDNGPKMEKMLMDWTNSPSPAALRNLPRKQVCNDDAETLAVK